MEKQRKFSDIPFEILLTWRYFVEALKIIRNEKLWVGFWKYGWVTAILIIAGGIVGIQFLLGIGDLLRSIWSGSSSDEAGIVTFGHQLENFLGGLFLVGSYKYVILILGEVLVFHLVRRTIEMLGGEKQDDSFIAFIHAQKRMIVIAFSSWIMELISTILISVAIGILGFDFLKPVFVFLVSAYFMGFTLTDNYFERNGVTVKESHKLNLNIIGVSLGLGVILSLLFLIPIVGPIFGTSVGAVAAAMTLFYLEKKGDLQLKPETEKS